MPNNPEQLSNSGADRHIPKEWQSLIQDGIYDVDHKRTDAYEQSYHGQRELNKEENAKFIEKRLEELDRQLSAGEISQERYDKTRERYEEKYNRILSDIDAIREDYQDSVYAGTPEEKDQYEQWLKSKDSENQANLEATGRTSRTIEVQDGNEENPDTPEQNPDSGEPAPTTTVTETPSTPAEGEETPAETTNPETKNKSAETMGLTREDAQYLHDQTKAIDELRAQNPDLIDDALCERLKNAVVAEFVSKHQANRQESDTTTANEVDKANRADIDAANKADIEAANEADIEAANEADKVTGEVKALSPAKSQELLKKSKAKRGFKAAIASLLAGVVLVSSLLIPGVLQNRANVEDTAQPTPIEQVADATRDAINNLGEDQEAVHGIYDGYYEKGMYTSNQKDGAYSFAAAHEIAEEVGADKCEIMKRVDHCMPEALADHLASLPDEVKDHYGLSEFGGLSILDTESMLENLSDEEYDAVLSKMDQVWDDAFTEGVVLNGEYQNAYMYTSASGDETVTHNNTQLVECVTQENGTEATRFFWTIDGNGNSERIGDMTVKIHTDENGNIAAEDDCTQVVHENGTTTIYQGMNRIPNNPPVPNNSDTPDKTPPPSEEGLQPKNTKAEIANAGPRVDQQELNQEVTPSTTIEQDQANISVVQEQQQSPGGMAGTQEEIARQQTVDNSTETAQNNAEATANADASAAERAQMFEEGNY